MNWPHAAACYRALQSRDARFDGWLYVGVTSTGIYCRPICPARTPRPEHCRFFPSAAAAQAGGFRPCLRCRPEIAPGQPAALGTAATIRRALTILADGDLESNPPSLARLAERLGVGERQLRRLFHQHLGAAPIAIAQTRRVLFAKQLIQETSLPLSEVALASGFGSVRRFQETFQALYHQPASQLRRGAKSRRDRGSPLRLRLSYRPPYHWDAMLGYLAARAIPGVEVVENGCYFRTITGTSDDQVRGSLEIRHAVQRNSLDVFLRLPSLHGLPALVERIRRMFDVEADILAIQEHLERDPFLRPLIAATPGLRLPGAWDGFESALRAILGQQISVAAARNHAAQLVERHGSRLTGETSIHPGLTHLFPTPRQLAAARRLGLAMPQARQQAVRALARAADRDRDLFCPRGSLEAAIEATRMLPGIGDWTAEWIAMRVFRETDAFPASDLGLLRAARQGLLVTPRPGALRRRAEAWRPWRAYAAQHLWTAGIHPRVRPITTSPLETVE